MKLLFLALSVVILFTATANAGIEDYYKYVGQYNKDKSEFLALKQRAENGDVKSQIKLGEMYFEGVPPGLPQNLKKSYKWFKLAADSGNAEAQYNVSLFFMEGINKFTGMEKNDQKVKEYLEKAADGGNRDSQKKLFIMNYAADYIVEKQDLVKAYKWATLALGEGEDIDKELEEVIPELENMMTGSEIQRAKTLVKKALAKRDAGKGGAGTYNRNKNGNSYDVNRYKLTK